MTTLNSPEEGTAASPPGREFWPEFPEFFSLDAPAATAAEFIGALTGEGWSAEADPLVGEVTFLCEDTAGCVASFSCSRRRWLQSESTSAIASKITANKPQGSGREGESEIASRRLILSSVSRTLLSRAFSRATVSSPAGEASPEACK